MSVTLIVKIRVKEGKMDEAISLLKVMVPKIKESEPGCLEYVPYTIKGPENENLIVFYEKYADKEAFDLHNKNLKTNMAEFNKILEPDVEINVCSEIL
ncbi:MAG: putative quinol monooxygenase [Promethearchaeota archaeon]